MKKFIILLNKLFDILLWFNKNNQNTIIENTLHTRNMVYDIFVLFYV